MFANAPSTSAENHGAALKKAPKSHNSPSVKQSCITPAAHPEFKPVQIFKARDSSSKENTEILQEGYKKFKNSFSVVLFFKANLRRKQEVVTRSTFVYLNAKYSSKKKKNKIYIFPMPHKRKTVRTSNF